MGVLYLVRHGQASFGTDDYDRLSDLGMQQARITGAHLASQGITPTRIIHGGLLRQRQTAEGILAGLGAAPATHTSTPSDATTNAADDRTTAAHSPAMQLDAGWDEYDAWGITGALSDTDPRASHDSRVFQDELERGCARWASGDHDADYAETHSAFTARVDRAFDDARAATGSGETTIVVSSAGSIGWTVARLMGGDFDQWMAFTRVTINTGITKIVTGRSGISLVSFNEHTHLAPDIVTYR